MSKASSHHRCGPSSQLIRLGGQSRMSRRALITNLGAAGIGLTILGACSSSDGAGGASATDAPSPDGTSSPATDTPSTDAPTDTEAPPATDAAASADELRLQHVSLGFVSAYVLVRGGEAAVVDTGQSNSAAAILEGLGAVGASWADVAHVVLTHNHGDHIGGLAGVLEQAPGATVYGGEADLSGVSSPTPLQAVGDGDEVLGLGVFNTPGHTDGSISLFDTETGILVAGDAINGEDGALTGANPRFSTDLETATASIGKLAALQPRVAAFGHGGPPIDTDVTAQLEALANA